MINTLNLLQFCQLYHNKTGKKRGNKGETPTQNYLAQNTILLITTILYPSLCCNYKMLNPNKTNKWYVIKVKNCCTAKCNRNITNYLYLSNKLPMNRQKTKKAKDLNRKVKEVQTPTVKKLKKISKLTRNKKKNNEVSLNQIGKH